MTSENSVRLRLHARLSALTILIGVALMIMMIVEEDEFGALPLALIVIGTGWLLITRRRARLARKSVER
jgi:Ca2+/Na+ antiporter